MSARTTLPDRHAPILAELAELGLSLARALDERALAAKSPAEAAQLTEAFHELSRSVRQTLALEARMERDRLGLDPEGTIEAAIARVRQNLGPEPPRR